MAAVLVTIAGFQLFVLGEHTDRYFAWTIASPITAAFIGAAYWSSLPLIIGGVRQQSWARTRISFFSPFVFTSCMLVATLLHLGALHLHAARGFAVFAAWAWIAVYVLVPAAEIVVLFFQLRAPGCDPPRIAQLSSAIRIALSIQAAVMLVVGAALFALPQTASALWPWNLTAFTAQVVGGWLLGLGVAGAQAVWENDWARVTYAILSYFAFGFLQAVVLLRYGFSLDWIHARSAIYVAFIASIVFISAWSMVVGRSALNTNRT
ncbi:MAG: hypothetical protein JO263_02375 [Candidatus Eremiobacteraeota bacterium]|nr:hypothetical protein [Candidatus Eremiobacteraeota bacterium]